MNWSWRLRNQKQGNQLDHNGQKKNESLNQDNSTEAEEETDLGGKTDFVISWLNSMGSTV